MVTHLVINLVQRDKLRWKEGKSCLPYKSSCFHVVQVLLNCSQYKSITVIRYSETCKAMSHVNINKNKLSKSSPYKRYMDILPPRRILTSRPNFYPYPYTPTLQERAPLSSELTSGEISRCRDDYSALTTRRRTLPPAPRLQKPK